MLSGKAVFAVTTGLFPIFVHPDNRSPLPVHFTELPCNLLKK